MATRDELIIHKERIMGEATRNENQKVQVSLISSSIGEYAAVTDLYMKDGKWTKGKGKWVPIDIADEIGALLIKAYTEWEEN